MMKRHAIYGGLLAFIAAGVLIDWYIWNGNPPSFTANDLVQLAGIILLTSWWQIVDADLREVNRSRLATAMTVLLAPVGLLIYLFQTRRPAWATAAFVVFLGGIVLALVAADSLGMAIFTNDGTA